MSRRILKSFVFVSLIALVVCSNLLTAFATETYTWEEKAAMINGRHAHRLVALEGKLYAIGGSITGSNDSDSVERYDPSTNSWIAVANLNAGRGRFFSSIYNGKIYVFGGYGSGYLDSVEVYDPASDTWTMLSSMPITRYHHSSVTVDNRIYIYGGLTENSEYVTQLDVYSPDTDTWETKTGLEYGRVNASITAIGSKIYIIGGTINGVNTTKVDVYDTTNDTWSVVSDMSNTRLGFELISYNYKIYAIGGQSSDDKEIEIYNTKIDSWQYTNSGPYDGWSFFGSALIGNTVYLCGGQDGIGYSDRLIAITLSEEILPPNLTATPGNAKVALNWDIIDEADTYTVKRAMTQGGPYTVIAENLTETSYLDSSVANGITYYYIVTAVNTAGESEPSNEASATPVAPIVNRAILNITMQNSLIKEYDMSMTEVDNFIDWYNSSTGSELYTIDKSYNIGPFLSRKDYLVKDMIVWFEVKEYQE